jgi:hypothetical protein
MVLPEVYNFGLVICDTYDKETVFTSVSYYLRNVRHSTSKFFLDCGEKTLTTSFAQRVTQKEIVLHRGREAPQGEKT